MIWTEETRPEPVVYDLGELAAVVAEWQELLGLTEWTIGVAIGRARDMRDEAQANIRYNWSNRQALLTLVDPLDYPGVSQIHPQDMEVSAVHELLHLKAFAWNPEPESLEAGLAERFFTDTARALVRLKREHSARNIGSAIIAAVGGPARVPR